MRINLPASDKVAVVGVANPKNGTGAHDTGWLSMAEFHQLMAIIAVGSISANGVVDAKIEQATDDQGADAKDVAGKAITALSQADTDDSNKQAIINVTAHDLDVNNNFAFVRLTITPSVAAASTVGVVLGVEPGYGPASNLDADSVAEIIA